MARILYIGAFNFPIGDAAAARVLNNGKILRDLGHEVIFIGMGQHDREEDKNEKGEYYYQGFQYYQTDEFRRETINVVKRTFKYLNRGDIIISNLKRILVERIDIIVAYHPSSIFTMRLKSISKRYNIKLVIDIAEWHSPNELPAGKYGPVALDNEILMRYIYPSIYNKILISKFLLTYYGEKCNSILLPPLVDSSESKWNSFIDVNDLFDQDTKGLRLIYAGTPGKKDSLDTMLKSIINLLNTGNYLSFYIVGVKQSEYTNSPLFNSLVKYEQYIKFLGRHSQYLIPSLYKQVDFSLIVREETTKSKAGFPTKLVESMMAGIPVITNITSDIGDYIIDGVNGFVLSDSSESSLTKLLINISFLPKDKLQYMKSQAKKCGLERFDYHNYILRTKNFLELLK